MRLLSKIINWQGVWYWIATLVWLVFVLVAIGIVFYQVWQIARQIVIQ